MLLERERERERRDEDLDWIFRMVHLIHGGRISKSNTSRSRTNTLKFLKMFKSLSLARALEQKLDRTVQEIKVR